MFTLLLSNWKYIVMAILLVVIGFLYVSLSHKEVVIKEKEVVISEKEQEITKRDAMIARVNQEIDLLKKSQENDNNAITALQALCASKESTISKMRASFKAELDACYKAKEVPSNDPSVKGKVVDDETNRAFVRLLNSISAPGVPGDTEMSRN